VEFAAGAPSSACAHPETSMRRIRTLEPSQRCAPSALLSADVHGKMHTHARAHMHTPPHRQRAHKRPVSSRADLVADTRTKKAWHMQRCTLILHGRIWAGAHAQRVWMHNCHLLLTSGMRRCLHVRRLVCPARQNPTDRFGSPCAGIAQPLRSHGGQSQSQGQGQRRLGCGAHPYL
jgi:hypothetical protein